MTTRRFQILLLSLLATLACGDPAPSEYPTQQVHLEDTTLGPGDVFEIRVYQQKEMTGIYSASAEGTISFPLIGLIKVTSKTPAKLETELTKRLADGYLVNPQVSVLIKEYKSKKVSVLGQVKKPGTLSYSEGMTIIEAVSQAGGLTPMARANAVRVTRPVAGQDGPQKYVVPVDSIGRGKAPNFFMRPGDTIFVPERVF